MTTVAWDGHTLAVDSKVSVSGTACGIENKLVQLDGGDIDGSCDWLACAGIREYGLAVARWLRSGRQLEERPKFKTEDRWGALWWHVQTDINDPVATGMYQWSDELLEPIPVCAAHAIGTGADLAIGAMMAGADARRAVEIACERDNASGLPVHSIELVPCQDQIRPGQVFMIDNPMDYFRP